MYRYNPPFKITCNYIVKEIDDIKEIYKVEVISNKALEAIINRLVKNQIKESEGLKSKIKKIKYIHNIKNHYFKKYKVIGNESKVRRRLE